MSITSAAHAMVRGLAEKPTWQLGDADLLNATEDLYRLVTAVNAQALRLLAEIDHRGLAADAGAPSTAAWLTARLQMNVAPARRQVALANSLGHHPATAAALAGGAVSVDNAQVVTTALDALPGSVDSETVAAAERTLLGEAERFTPRMMTRIGQRLHTALDPDGPRPDDTEQPDPGYYLNLRTCDDGSAEGEFRLDAASAAHLVGMIHTRSAPRPSTLEGPDLRSAGQRRADALADLIQLAAGQTEDPGLGSGRNTVIVTVSLAELRAGLPGLGNEHALIPAATMRQIACDAQVIPAVLGARSEVLDIGRASRTIPAKIYRALVLRDRHCAFPGCDRPPGWTQAHHIRHWAQGGPTALSNLVLLCRHHHDTVHHRGWKVRLDGDRPVFTRPTWLRRRDVQLAV